MTRTDAAFFITGGTVPRDAPSYIERQADTDLLDGLRRGQFCYVLTPRQMGKSSLMVRAAARLRAGGATCVILDLTSLGQNVSLEQWYGGLLRRIGQQVDLEDALDDFWLSHSHLGPWQRWMLAIERIVLPACTDRLILFVDEIDAVLSLKFKESVDEFFAGIRECYNRRAESPVYEKLTFCLLGVATPSSLIRDTRTTPFNIGRRIDLTDFTLEEAHSLARGLGQEEAVNAVLLRRVLYWTGGHPYLTQRLCRAVSECPSAKTAAAVDRLCDELFLSAIARNREDNLLFVRDRLLYGEQDTTTLLLLYAQVRRGKVVQDDSANVSQGALHLSGIVRGSSGRLAVRNRIYDRVFDEAWVREHVPDAEARRQKAAYRRGVLRALAVSALFLTALGLALTTRYQFRRAEQAGRYARLQQRLVAEGRSFKSKADNLGYAADMNLAQQAFDNGDYGRLAQLLKEHKPGPGDESDLRGFEWRYFWRLMHRDLHTFKHPGKGIVSSVAFSRDGKTLASANEDGTIKLWDFATRQEMRRLTGHKYGSIALAFNPVKPYLLASGSYDNTVMLWDIRTGRLLKTLEGQRGDQIFSVAFSPDGRWLVAGTDQGEILLWNATSYRFVTSRTETGAIFCGTAFSPDRRWLAAVSREKTALCLWEFPSLRGPKTIRQPDDLTAPSGCFSMAFAPDRNLLAAGRGDGKVVVWEVPSLRQAALLRGHDGLVNGIAFSRNGRYLATSSWDNTIRLWDVATWKLVGAPIIGSLNKITTVAFSPDGTLLASGGNDEVKLWAPRHREVNPRRLDGVPGNVTRRGVGSLAFRNGALGMLVCHYKANSATIANRVTWWDCTHQRDVPVCEARDPGAAAYSPDGKTLAVGIGYGTVVLWDVAARQFSAPFQADPRHYCVHALAFSHDGRRLAVSSGDSALVTLWDVASRRQIDSFTHSNCSVDIAFSPDDRILAAANWRGFVYLWDIAARKQIRWMAHARPVNGVAFSPDGKTLATASDDGTVKLWNVATRREMVTLRSKMKRLLHVTFSPDGTELAAANADGETLVWRADSLKEVSLR